MKKIAFLSVIALLVFACNSNTKQSEITLPEPVNSESDATPADTHNSKNSLDYKGIYYADEIPTASGSGMSVTIALGDSTYTKEVAYKETKENVKSEGKYSWDDQGSVITLEGEDKPNQYAVEENALRQLDIEGNKITGDLENLYILQKKQSTTN